MSIEPLKPSVWPRWIEKDGERYEFAQSKPGWLVYENDKRFILVGRQEAFTLAVDPDTAPPRSAGDAG